MSTKVTCLFWAFVTALFFALVWLFKPMLTPFVVGAVVAYLLNPLMNKFVKLRLSRRLAALIILFIFFAALTLILMITVPMLAREATQLAQSLPALLKMAQSFMAPHLAKIQEGLGGVVLEDWTVYVEKYLSQALSMGAGVAANIAGGGMAAVGVIMTVLLVPIASYFMMKDWPKITSWVQSLMPVVYRNTIEDLLAKMDVKISGFIRGQIMVCLLLGFMYAIALTIAGLKSGFLIGIMTGILSIIPYVGSTIGLVSSLGIAWFQSSDLTYVGMIAAIFFVGQFIEGNFIAPKLVGDSVGLHPLWVIFALLAGGTLFGVLGVFLAIPVAAVISVLISFALQQYRNSAFFKAGPRG